MDEEKKKGDSKTEDRVRKANKILNILIVAGLVVLIIMLLGLKGMFLWY